MIREEFEAWAKSCGHHVEMLSTPQYTPGRYLCDFTDARWIAWQAATQATIKRIQAAAIEPVLLPGAIVLPGDFFAKEKK